MSTSASRHEQNVCAGSSGLHSPSAQVEYHNPKVLDSVLPCQKSMGVSGLPWWACQCRSQFWERLSLPTSEPLQTGVGPGGFLQAEPVHS